MNKPIDAAVIDRFLTRWEIEPDGAPFSTHSSVLQPATRTGAPVMLKLTPEPDEIRGGGLLAWWDGQGAVRVLEREPGAILMERPIGNRSLLEVTRSGADEMAVEVLCAVAHGLHRPRTEPLPELQPLAELFTPLLASESPDPLIQQGRHIVSELLAAPIEVVPLHGDLQHYNVLDAVERGWLAIDPKGQLGERTYDFVNLFRNPEASIATNPVVFARRLEQIERCADLDRQRLARWIVGFCTLCLVWDYYPQGSADDDRQLAALALAVVG